MSWASWPKDWQGCHLRRLGRTSLNVSCVRWSFVVFFFLVLIKLISLLGKNLPEDTADFGKDSLASRRHLGTGCEDCFQISICLLWPHALCTQDLKHALSTAYLVKHATPHPWCLVKHATPHPWCICVDSLDFSFSKHAHSGLKGTTASWASFRIDVVVVAALAANCESS